MYVYLEGTEPGGTVLFTVGFFDGAGNWHGDSDHTTRDSAAARVTMLNGGSIAPTVGKIVQIAANDGQLFGLSDAGVLYVYRIATASSQPGWHALPSQLFVNNRAGTPGGAS